MTAARQPYSETLSTPSLLAPFTVVRQWRLPIVGGALITKAIKVLEHVGACKVVLEYPERFWEKYSNPIYMAAVAL